MRHHLQFNNFHSSILKATDKLFRSKPWRGDDEEQFVKYERWLRSACEAYRIKPVALEIHHGRFSASYQAEPPTIILNKYSVLSLFHEFRHHMQMQDVARVHAGSLEGEHDARGWSCSLFYRSRPTLFRKAVRNGGVLFVVPEDLLHPDTPIVLCRHCEENVFPHQNALEEGEETRWLHVETGLAQCPLETDDELFAAPVMEA